MAHGKYYRPKPLIGVLEFMDRTRKGSVSQTIFNDTEDSNPHHSHCFLWKLSNKRPLTQIILALLWVASSSSQGRRPVTPYLLRTGQIMGFWSNPTLHSSQHRHAIHCSAAQPKVARRSAPQRSRHNTELKISTHWQSSAAKPAPCLPCDSSLGNWLACYDKHYNAFHHKACFN